MDLLVEMAPQTGVEVEMEVTTGMEMEVTTGVEMVAMAHQMGEAIMEVLL